MLAVGLNFFMQQLYRWKRVLCLLYKIIRNTCSLEEEKNQHILYLNVFVEGMSGRIFDAYFDTYYFEF